MANKKIKNATPLEFDGIKFKSKLEVMAYKTLKENGLNSQYEPKKFVLIEGFKPSVEFYTKNKKTKELELEDKKIIAITYTPDFVLNHKGWTYFVECKGMQNDCYYLKRKLFRRYLELNMPCSKFFEIYTKGQLLTAISIIKDEEIK